MDYDPELFGKALPCLTAIGCALPPDYSLSKNYDDEWYGSKSASTQSPDGPYNPQPINTSRLIINSCYINNFNNYISYEYQNFNVIIVR